MSIPPIPPCKQKLPSYLIFYILSPISIIFLIYVLSHGLLFIDIHPGSLKEHMASMAPKFTIDNNTSYSMKFAEHEDYQNLSHEFNHLWTELLPPNGGFLLEVGEDEQVHKYGLSMFHQLHCVGMLREAVQGLSEAIEELKHHTTTGHERRNAERGQEQSHSMSMSNEHWIHCFDYLRQTILCNADATIEPPRINSHGKETIDGMIERQCMDPRRLWDLSIQSDERVGKHAHV